MAKFKNLVTGNVLETDNPLTMDAPAVEAAAPTKKSGKAKAAAAAEEDA